ncbi:hypothetical protein DFH08DRAFT_513226 [Mycena albidolilacea]|uniref:Uncharacterized protein n=1 Tax=Mycena albidolilacea TaxID=1033008 RepID=A0AAD6Z441_9AGAR|nr:hypothetical protein DFH08DRAFT_513226 [Mycena albidolilacea]
MHLPMRHSAGAFHGEDGGRGRTLHTKAVPARTHSSPQSPLFADVASILPAARRPSGASHLDNLHASSSPVHSLHTRPPALLCLGTSSLRQSSHAVGRTSHARYVPLSRPPAPGSHAMIAAPHCAISESAMPIDVPLPAASARPPYMLLHDIDRRRVVHPPHHYSGIIPTQPIRLRLRSGPHDLVTARSGRGEIWAGRARRGTYVSAACCRCRVASYLGSSERRCAQAAGAASLRAPAPERVRPAWGRRSARRCASALGVGTMADVLCELRESLMLHAGPPCAGGRTSCSRRRT